MKLPKNLKYLEAPAARYATNDVLWVPKAYRHIKRLKPDDIDTLKKLYRTIEKRKHARRIGNWLNEADLDTRAPEGAVWRLGLLFEHLAELGVEPFKQRSIDIFEADDELVDFSDVPTGFRFLIPAAAEFGHAWHEDLISELLESIESDRKKQAILKKAAAKLLARGADDLQTWLEGHDGSDDPAAERI